MQKDNEFKNVQTEVENACSQRLQKLKGFHSHCEKLSQQTKQLENMLKEKETERYNVQIHKETLEKTLGELTEKNLKASSENYKLNYQYKLLS